MDKEGTRQATMILDKLNNCRGKLDLANKAIEQLKRADIARIRMRDRHLGLLIEEIEWQESKIDAALVLAREINDTDVHDIIDELEKTRLIRDIPRKTSRPDDE